MAHTGELRFVSTNLESGGTIPVAKWITACGEESRYVVYSEDPCEVTCPRCLSSPDLHEDLDAMQRQG